MRLLRKKNDFTLQNVEEVLELKTWWAALAILPFSRRLTLFVCNYTEIKPNTITLFSFTLRLISALFFVQGQYIFLVIGAIIFEISYGLDCVDGSVARLKNLTSNMGAFFDHITDTLGICINLFALALGNNILLSPVVLATVSLYLFIHYMTFVANAILIAEAHRIRKGRSKSLFDKNLPKNESSGILDISEIILKYKRVFAERHFKAFFSAPDFEALLFFIFPLLGKVDLGFHVGIYFLIVIFIYKLCSYLYVIKNAMVEDVAG